MDIAHMMCTITPVFWFCSASILYEMTHWSGVAWFSVSKQRQRAYVTVITQSLCVKRDGTYNNTIVFSRTLLVLEAS